MLQSHIKIILLLNLLFFFSCRRENQNQYLTYNVVKSDFVEDIMLDGTVEAVNSRNVVCPEVWDVTISFIVEDGTFVREGDTVVILENKQMLDQYERLQNNLERNLAEYNKSQADLALNYALLEAQVKNNEAQTAISNLSETQLQFASEVQRKITEKELQIAKIEKEKLKRKLSSLKRINEAELRKFGLRIKQSENQIAYMKTNLDKLVLTAPQDGLALRMQAPMGNGKFKEGDNAYPGMPIVEIPDLSLMRVKIQANETAYKRMNVGLPVEYTFDGMPGNKAYGKITMKSVVGNPISRNSKIRVFDILASVDSCHTLPGAGLSANCRVVINHLPDQFVVPNIALYDEDSVRVVYVKASKGFERREVNVGMQSAKSSVVAAGLYGGEALALIKPKSKLIKGETMLQPTNPEETKNKADTMPDQKTEISNINNSTR